MARRFFVAGCVVLLATGLVHLLGHYAMVTNQGDGETERQLLALMHEYRQDMGFGFVRSTFDILTGFSLTFSILTIGLGMLGLAVQRHTGVASTLLQQTAVVYAGIFGIMTGMALRYWFFAPLFFLAAAFLCFVGAVATRGGSSS